MSWFIIGIVVSSLFSLWWDPGIISGCTVGFAVTTAVAYGIARHERINE